MDVDRAAGHLEAFLALLRTNRAAFTLRDQIFASNAQWQETQEQILAHRPLIVAIVQELDDALAVKLSSRDPLPWEWQDAEEATAEALGMLRDREEFQAVLGPGPFGSVGRIHGAIWRNVAPLWQEAEYGYAVKAAATFVFGTMLPNKLDRFDLAGVELVNEAFNLEPPKPGRPRLRLPRISPDTEAWTVAHSGARHFGLGCALMARGLVGPDGSELDEAAAFEILIALSAMARWIDQAHVQRARA